MKRGVYAFATFLLLFPAIVSLAIAGMDHKMGHQADGEIKVVEGVKGRLKVTPEMSMIDLYLADARTGEVITGAKVKAMITMPDGKKLEKDLPGMKMGETFSYMNTLDLSLKGVYTFDITAEVKKKIGKKDFDKERVTFSFTYEVR